MPFLCHANGKAYIIVAEKEKKHTFLRFLNKTKINVYESGGNVDQKSRTLGSPQEAVKQGLLKLTEDQDQKLPKVLFNTVSTQGAKLLMEFDAKKFSNEEAIGSKLRENIQELTEKRSLSPMENVTVPQENPKPKNRPHVTFVDEPPVTPPPTVTSSPREADPLDIQNLDESRRGVLDELKEGLANRVPQKRSPLPPTNPPTAE